MKTSVILDTGPLVAYLRKRDYYHTWAMKQLDAVTPPVFTCEPVLTEACFLLKELPDGSDMVLRLVETGQLRIAFSLADEMSSVKKLITRYANVPMSLADACLVRMSERKPHCSILTMDSDFNIYRRNGKEIIPVIMPPA